ncbi:MAG: FAD-dependent oxidoreductase, partial [Actinomycetota bacterium]
GQSACQIAEEIHESGRRTYLCVGRTRRLPRRYRGRDGVWWATRLGMLDQTVDQLDSPAERFVPNPLISGKDGGHDIDLHGFARQGITLLGRLEDVRDGRAMLAPDLHDRLRGADTMVDQFRQAVDKLIAEEGLDVPSQEIEDEPRVGYDHEIIPELDLSAAGIETVIWATGYRWDFGWIDPPVLDEYGYPLQTRGVTEHPGLYFLGLHWMHTLKSGLLLGVGDDAAHVTAHLNEYR